MEEKKKSRNILESTFFRIVVFFVLAISFAFGTAGVIGTVYLCEEEVYTSSEVSFIHDRMVRYIWDDVGYLKRLYEQEDLDGMEAYLTEQNVSVEIYDGDSLLWSNYDGMETRFSFVCYTDAYLNLPENADAATDTASGPLEILKEEDDGQAEPGQMEPDPNETDSKEEQPVQRELTFRLYVDENFPWEDTYKEIYVQCQQILDYIYVIPLVAVVGVFLFLVSFIYLMCSAGHHRGKEGITGGVLSFFHFDVLTVIFGCVAAMGLLIIDNIRYYSAGDMIVMGILLTMEASWGTIYCMEFAVQLKLGTIWKHTFIYTMLCSFGRALRAMWRGFCSLLRGLPLLMNVLVAYGGFCILELVVLIFFYILWSMDAEVVFLWFLEKIVILPILLYFALICKKLQKGSEALAEGNLSYKLDTSSMILDFKEHGENLNRIGEGIALAVEERMRSEHLKTELITNVSHDLKTPLTSIINYADLIGTAVSEQPQNTEQLQEYAEVLLRQSGRLKKLLDDLVEASKATTGNLEVNLAPCEIGVILSQAVGEYEQRFAEKKLELIVRQPKEPVSIQADGRHFWRVFDNLFSNIFKYAQENTRVYVTVEKKEDQVEIIFRNMSSFPLEISAEELKERFVRGDKSRHVEGNGLGLSIAGSLVELQNGRMEIVTDGDLFKVILIFPVEQ